jgi:hypothetical protein
MRIKVYRVAFGRWKAEMWVDDVIYGVAIAPNPACAVKDAMAEFCVKQELPEREIEMEIVSWE